MTIDCDTLKTKFVESGQGHVFTFYDKLDSEEQQSLLGQLKEIDPEFCNKIFKAATSGSGVSEAAKLAPLPETSFASTIERAKGDAELKLWEKLGMDAISKGKVGVILMAGGQGTRLGSSKPKGCYDIELPSHKSLFQLQAERIARLQHLCKATIPWYIMKLGPDTETYFKEMNYFGLDSKNVRFFEQGTLPAFTMDGKILLETRGKVSIAPDGNGGIYRAMRDHGVLADMKSRGIEYLHAYCVDNCLVKVADPVFLGFGIDKKAQCGAKVVRKVDANESVGVICLRNSRAAVVEYSEIDPAVAAQKTSDGKHLLYRAANIANHFYTLDFLESVKAFETQLEYHVAKKKIKHVTVPDGEPQAPKEPNGIKLELFVFDVFPCVDLSKFAVLEVERKEEFSPLKNAKGSGSDCPETSRADIMSQHLRFLQGAGAQVDLSEQKDLSPLNPPVVEISPLVSYAGEGLESLRGKKLKLPVLLQSPEDL